LELGQDQDIVYARLRNADLLRLKTPFYCAHIHSPFEVRICAGGSPIVSLKYVFTAQRSPLPAAASPVFHSFVALLCPRFRQYALTYEVCYRAENSFTVSFPIGFAIKVEWEK